MEGHERLDIAFIKLGGDLDARAKVFSILNKLALLTIGHT